MLRGEQSIVTFTSGQAYPDRLTRQKHAHYVEYANRAIAIYQSGTGRTRRELHRAVNAIFAREPDCDRRRIAALCKLLDEAADYAGDSRGAAAELRLRVFGIAARFHPLVEAADRIFERPESEVKRLIAAELGRPWHEIETSLYVDVMDFQPLRCFSGYPDGAALLSRYNVAQLQACLYKAQAVTIMARSDFQSIVRNAKLARAAARYPARWRRRIPH